MIKLSNTDWLQWTIDTVW